MLFAHMGINPPPPPIHLLFLLLPLVQVEFNNTYSTTAFAARAVDLIQAQAAKGPAAPPLFLYLA